MSDGRSVLPRIAIGLAVVAAILLPLSLYVRHNRQQRAASTATRGGDGRGSASAEPPPDPWASPDDPLPPRYTPPRYTPPAPPPPPPTAPPAAPTTPDPSDPFASRQGLPVAPDAGTCGTTCTCEDGSVTHAMQMVNGVCLDAAETCRRVCESHDGVLGTWNPSRGKRLGEACSYAAQCAQKVCNHGLCSRTCKTFGDCPPGWDCDRPSLGDEGECRKR